MQEQAQRGPCCPGEHQGQRSHVPRLSLCFPRRRRRRRSTRPSSPRSRARTARPQTATELSPPARGPSAPGRPVRLPRRRSTRSTGSSPGMSRAGWAAATALPRCTPRAASRDQHLSCSRDTGVSFSKSHGRVVLQVLTLLRAVLCHLGHRLPLSATAAASPGSRHPAGQLCCPTASCSAGAAASSSSSSLGDISAVHGVGVAQPGPRRAGDRVWCCWAPWWDHNPLAQSSGLQTCPSSLGLSANTASAGARSKRGSGDTGSKHGLWSVCCLGKGWKINLCPLQLYFGPAPFFCTFHTSSWAGGEQRWPHGGDRKGFFWEVLAASRGSRGWEGGVW